MLHMQESWPFCKVCRNKEGDAPKLSSVKVSKVSEGIQTAPTVRMELISEDGRAKVQVLPDSGAGICVIGVDVLRATGGHENNLLSSNMVHSRAVNGTIMKPIGTLPVLFKHDGKQTEETVHVYKNVKGALMSWSTSKRIGILPKCYPKSLIKKNVRQVKETASRNPANKPYYKHEMRGADSPRVREVRVSQLTDSRRCKQCQDRLPRHPPEPRHMKARPERPFQDIAMDLAAYGGRKLHGEQITVKAMKKLISGSWNNDKINEDKRCRSLLQHRNTPCGRDGLSPAQKLYGHPTQDFMPAHRRAFAPEWQKSQGEIQETIDHKDTTAKQYQDQRAHSLKELTVGTNVAIYNPSNKLWNIYGTIVQIGAYSRYRIKTEAGRILVRSRRFIRRRSSESLASNSGLSEVKASSGIIEST